MAKTDDLVVFGRKRRNDQPIIPFRNMCLTLKDRLCKTTSIIDMTSSLVDFASRSVRSVSAASAPRSKNCDDESDLVKCFVVIVTVVYHG